MRHALIRQWLSFVVVLFATACLHAAPRHPTRVLDRSLDLQAFGQLLLGQPMTTQGGRRLWPDGLLANRDCFGPCYEADSAYLFDFQRSTGISFVVALLDDRGRVHAIAAFFSIGHSFDYVYPAWRSRYGPPSCGGPGHEEQLPTWLDSHTAVVFSGNDHWDIHIPMALRLMDRMNPHVARYASDFECPTSPPNKALQQTAQTR